MNISRSKNQLCAIRFEMGKKNMNKQPEKKPFRIYNMSRDSLKDIYLLLTGQQSTLSLSTAKRQRSQSEPWRWSRQSFPCLNIDPRYYRDHQRSESRPNRSESGVKARGPEWGFCSIYSINKQPDIICSKYISYTFSLGGCRW